MIGIGAAMAIGKRILEDKTRAQLELLEKDPLRRAQAQYWEQMAGIVPYQGEVYQAQARQAIPANALRDVSVALFGIPSESILRLSQAQIYPTVALGNIANISSSWLNNEALNKFFRGLGPSVFNLLSGFGGLGGSFSALPDLSWGW